MDLKREKEPSFACLKKTKTIKMVKDNSGFSLVVTFSPASLLSKKISVTVSI